MSHWLRDYQTLVGIVVSVGLALFVERHNDRQHRWSAVREGIWKCVVLLGENTQDRVTAAVVATTVGRLSHLGLFTPFVEDFMAVAGTSTLSANDKAKRDEAVRNLYLELVAWLEFFEHPPRSRLRPFSRTERLRRQLRWKARDGMDRQQRVDRLLQVLPDLDVRGRFIGTAP